MEGIKRVEDGITSSVSEISGVVVHAYAFVTLFLHFQSHCSLLFFLYFFLVSFLDFIHGVKTNFLNQDYPFHFLLWPYKEIFLSNGCCRLLHCCSLIRGFDFKHYRKVCARAVAWL